MGIFRICLVRTQIQNVGVTFLVIVTFNTDSECGRDIFGDGYF